MKTILLILLVSACSHSVKVKKVKIVAYDRQWCGKNLTCTAYVAVDDGSEKLQECRINNDMLDDRHNVGFDEINKQCLLLKKPENKY
jgi:hypothetical protein